MRRMIALAPLLLASCTSLFGADEPARPAAPPQDPVALVSTALDEERVLTDARDAALQAALDDLSQQVSRLGDELAHVRSDATENAAAALAAESAAASAQRMLLLTTIVAVLAVIAALVLGVVVAWQSVLLRRAQRAEARAEVHAAEDAERTAMAATRPAASAVATGPAAPAPGARLRQRPLP